MPRKVALPDPRDCLVACFHYNPMKNPNRVTLQIPDEKFEDSNTYSLSLNSASDTAYIIKRKNGLLLLDLLKLHGHVAYKQNGDCLVLEDKDVKTATSRFGAVNARADREHPRAPQWPSESNWKVSALWRKKS